LIYWQPDQIFFGKNPHSDREICKTYQGYCIVWHWCNCLHNKTHSSSISFMRRHLSGS
jgi:hypothetical protein